MVSLVTRWYGCFIYDDKACCVDSHLFPPDPEIIAEKLISISNQTILSEEETLCTKYPQVLVNQKRLRKLGSYRPQLPIFSQIDTDLESDDYSLELLYQASLKYAEAIVEEKLGLPDYSIIQNVHAIDDLHHAINLFDERIEVGTIFSSNKETLSHLRHIKELMTHESFRLQDEVKKQMQIHAPNTSQLIGSLLAARLLVHAGSFEKLACLPASSIQLLGAEKALFRFKKEGGKPPKHGVLFQHESLLKAPKKEKGRVARLLSLKIILAIRADVYTKRSIGTQLKEEFTKQLELISQEK